jgi:predicted 3-demethylubiquinone-9 3-methyltransferase (glyoxalase superfamily)
MAKSTICLWFDKDAEAAARFYAETFPGSAVGAVRRAPSDYPFGKKGDVLTVEFTITGIPCVGLNGGPAFKHNEACQRRLRSRQNPTVRTSTFNSGTEGR